jgi:peptidoglycan-N-acetylglucosamine deacetylase
VTAERIGLSFDDGPSPWTGPILDLLAAHDQRATFFVIGSAAELDPGTVRRITAEGHEVGNHTWSHPALSRDCDDRRVHAELSRTNDLLDEILGSPARLFRAPHYDHDPRVDAIAHKLSLRHADGHVVPPDWHPGAKSVVIATLVLQGIHPGVVVGLHDGIPPGEAAADATRQATVDAVARILPALTQRGISGIPVSELLDDDLYRQRSASSSGS